MSSLPDDVAAVEVERHLWTVILAGGVGSRFWPASTPSQPKQLLPLAGPQPLIRETVDRIIPLVPQERLRILTGSHLAEPICGALSELGTGNLLLEPRAAGTAPVLAWAAAEIERRDPDAVMISLHADHVIDPPESRGFIIGGLPHTTAVVRERKSGQRWVVDGWTHANGELPD